MARCASGTGSHHPPKRTGAREGAAEGDLVRVLEVTADREAGGEAGDGDVRGALVQLARDVERRGLAGGGRVGGEDDLAHAVLHPAVELTEAQILRLDAVDR